MTYRIQREIPAPAGVPGRLWRTEAARGRRVVAERLALNLRTDGRKTARADQQPAYRVR
jgi:hypothetical protein